ncbi:MBL fold metallo-hydrolase [Brevibacillus sp. SYP-B805]|uniref:MBL fold metallo-hydrolase n=1 Tax=Brevibacillus sp. SYP-B805 TaxID=1578199 RepID=UPI001F498A17|nr:MBL fold metallo-hydrolase [Brevibacillus sp. SYP-B805]
MPHITRKIAEHVWAIITYEEAWKSFINNYVIARDDRFLLIDTNLRKHRPYVQQALQQIGVTEERIEQVFFTHRHPDHIGNAEMFPSRLNWIHLEDFFELDDFSQTLFGHTLTGKAGEVSGLSFKQLAAHTEGSVAYFDPASKICFIGDHLCFFAEPLGEVVGEEAERRAQYLRFIAKWKEQEPEKVAAFREGVEAVLEWPVQLLATGHGPILKGEIDLFLRAILTELDS